MVSLTHLDRRLVFHISVLWLLHSRDEAHKCKYSKQIQSDCSRKAKGSERT